MTAAEADMLIAHTAFVNNPEAVQAMHQALQGQEVYFRIHTINKSDPVTGAQVEVAAGSPLLHLPSGDKALLVHTSKDDPKLERPFGGAAWQHALRIAYANPEAAGLVLVNAKGDSVALDRASVQRLLNQPAQIAIAPPRSRRLPS